MENLPDEIVVDVTTLGLGKSIFVGDLQYDNITLLTPASTAVCAVKMTRAARGAAAAAAEYPQQVVTTREPSDIRRNVKRENQ